MPRKVVLCGDLGGGNPILPGTGRGTSRRLVEGVRHDVIPLWHSPSTTSCAGGPPPRAGEDLARLAGLAGALLGWSADQFWGATPAELAGVVAALVGDGASPGDAALVARLREVFPDG